MIPQDSCQVVNSGVTGDNTRDLLSRFSSDVESYSPDVLAITVGTNDALNSSKSLDIAEFRENIKTLLDLAGRTASTVVLIIPPPCYDPYVRERHPVEFFAAESPGGKLERYNDILRAVAREGHALILDMHAHFMAHGMVGLACQSWIRNEENSGARDGVHPTPTGYRQIALSLHALMKNPISPGHTTVCFGDSITFGVGATGAGETVGESYPAILHSLLHQHGDKVPSDGATCS